MLICECGEAMIRLYPVPVGTWYDCLGENGCGRRHLLVSESPDAMETIFS